MLHMYFENRNNYNVKGDGEAAELDSSGNMAIAL